MTVDEILNEYDVLIKNYGKKNLEFLNHKASYLQKLEKYDEAEVLFNKAIEINPDIDYPWFNKACMESMRNNLEKSIEYLKKAIDINSINIKMAIEDKEFDNIRESEEFKKLTG